MSELIAPPYAPPAASPYSPGLLTGDWIFLSGQGGFDPDTGELVSDDVAGLTGQVFRNVEVLRRAAGMWVEVTVVARRPGRAASAVTPAGS